MKILHMLKTLVTVKGLNVLLLGKEVTTPDGASLGFVAAIQRELSRDSIWMVIDNVEKELMIPIEQIASVANKIILFGDDPLANSIMNEHPGTFLNGKKASSIENAR